MGISKSYLKELAEKKKYQSGGKVNVSPKTVEGYRKQYQDEVASLKDWYEKNRSRINTSVPSAYLRNQAYGPGNQSNDPYQPGQDFYPAYPFSFPELNFNIDGQPASWNYQTGIPKSFMHTLPGADQLPIPFIPPKDNVLTLSNDPQNIRDYVSEAKISGIKPNPITGAFSIDTPLILSHELGHYLNYNNPEVYQFNKQKLAETGITDTKAFQNYYGLGNRLGDSEETGAMRIVEGLSKDRKYNEFLSDAYALKQAMRREGLYDYTKGEKLTPEIWNKFKDKYGDQLVYKRFADVFQDTPKDEPDTKNVMFYLPDKNSELYLKNKEFWDSKEKYINDVYVPNLKKERLYTNYYPDKPADVYEFMQEDQAPPPNIDSGTTYIPGVDIPTEEGPVQYEGSDIWNTKIPTDMWLPESGSKRGSWMKENFYNKYENTEEGRNKAYQDFLKTRRANQPLKSPDERTIEFLNEIVKNDSEPVSIAKRGALIPKYQSGGFSTEDKQFSVKKSTIPGANKGLFSKTPIKQGKLIGLAHENNQPVGTLGNMHNHSETPNMQSVKIGNQRYVYATRDIQPGEELTTNYRLQPELEQPKDFMGNKRFGQKGFYKPDFRSKSQIAADYGNTGESTKVAPKINPVDMRKAQEAAMQRAIANQPTFRQGRTLSASEQAGNQARLAKLRDQQQEEENRRSLTFTGNAEARGAGTLMQPLLDVINPFSYYYSGKDALRGLGQAAEGVTNLNLGQIGSGLAGATFGALGAIPATSEFKPLFGAAGKTLAKPALKAASNLGKPGVSRNLADLQAAKKFAKQYGYELPKNLKRVAESDVLTDRTIRGLMNRHNTVVRGVSTNWDEIQKHVPFNVWDDIVKNFEKEGIDYINNPKAAAEYMATHIPVRTGYGRVGLKPGEDALYLSNSMPTAEGYTYGQGYAVKAKRPTDFSSVNRQDWIKANEFPVSYGFKNSPFGTGIVKSDYAKRVPTSLRDVAYAAGDPSIIQNAIKRSEEAYDLARTRHSGLQQKYVDKMWNRRLDFIEKNNPELLGKGSIWKYKMPLADRAKELYYNSLLKASNISKELSGIPPIVGGLLDRRNMAALGKNLFSPVFGRMDPYAHYIFKGTPGEKVLEPIRSVKITPEMWSNQSRAHVGKYSRGLTRRELGGTIPAKTYQGGGTNIDLKLPQFGEDKPRPFFEITGAGTGPQYDVFGYGYVPLGKNLGISADLMRWKEGDWRGGGYGISGNINIPINRGERKIRPTVKEPVMFQGGGTMGIPGVNGQVVSSGPTPLTSVKKTRGSMSMDNKGNVKTMPTKAVKKILKNIK